MDLIDYVLTLFHGLPLYLYKGLFVIFIIGAILLLVRFRYDAYRYIARLSLVEYTFLIYASTVIYRGIAEKKGTNFIPFSSYGVKYLILENIMNILVFFVWGVLLSLSFKRINLLCATLVGCFFSISIETMQLLTGHGSCDIDDVINNTLGCILGYAVVFSISSR